MNEDHAWAGTPPESWRVTWTGQRVRWVRGTVLAPLEVHVEVAGYRGFDVELVARSRWQGFYCAELRIAARDEFLEPVTYEALRNMPVGVLLRTTAVTLTVYAEDEAGGTKVTLRDYAPGTPLVMEKRALWPRYSEVAAVSAAAVYNLAEAAGYPPREAVASAFDVSRATASRIVAEARRQDLIPPYRPPAPGEDEPVDDVPGVTFAGIATASASPTADHSRPVTVERIDERDAAALGSLLPTARLERPESGTRVD